jgi:hypothetical protein
VRKSPARFVLLTVSLSAAALRPASASPALDQEVVPPTEAADTQIIVKTISAGVQSAYALGARPAMRDAHAKGHGCVKATFQMRPNIPSRLKAGVFAAPKTYTAWIRFSNGSGTPHDDATGDGRGMAIKLTDVPGKKILPDEIDARTQDFIMINYPVFFIRNVAEYVPFTRLSLQGEASEYFAAHPHEQAISEAITAKTVDEVFEQRYFSMAPYLLGQQYIKFSAYPVDCRTGAAIGESRARPPRNDPNYLREGMIRWLKQKDACFTFAVQPQTDAAAQPIEDPTALWDEHQAPFIDVASIRIPQQTFDTEGQQTFCENLSFTPWHALPDERPVGGINRLRRAVYQTISTLRHKLNDAPRREPTGNETFQ